MPNGRSKISPSCCSTHTIGRSTRAISSIGRATSDGQRLGPLERQRLRYELAEHDETGRSRRENAITKPSQVGIASPSRSRTSGSPTAPVRIPIAVIPTCTVEITRTGIVHQPQRRPRTGAPGIRAAAAPTGGP